MKYRCTAARAVPLLAVFALVLMSGCTTVREIANLRDVDFAIDDVGEAILAGIDVRAIRGIEDIRTVDMLRLTAAIAGNQLPLDLTINLAAENPETNKVQARLVRLDWTLLLDDNETISGIFDENVVLPPGEPQIIPFALSVDLIQFFGKNLEDLVNVALAASGRGVRRTNIKLRAVPTIDTPLGPMRYPNAITIVQRDVGS